MRILYFAWLRERIGEGSEVVELPDGVTTPAALVEWLRTRGPRYEAAFADTSSLRVALDQEQAEFDTPLAGVQEVALFPPVTGG